MYKVTFVVPVYNKAEFISESLNSLVNQSLRDIEILVINDGSTDHSQDIIDLYSEKDDRIKVIKFDINGGASEARNYGNEKASADLICVQDADDIAMPKRAEVIYTKFDRFKDIDILHSSFIAITPLGKIDAYVKSQPFSIDNVIRDGFTYIGHTTMAYKKKVVNAVKYTLGEWSKQGIEDWKLQMDLFCAGYKFKNLSDFLIMYRMTSTGLYANRDEKQVKILKEGYLKNYEKSKSFIRMLK